MNIGFVNSLLGDHVLYKLKDKGSGALQGFAFVKKDQETTENLREMDFVPADLDTILGFDENEKPLATSDLGINGQNSDKQENKNKFETPESKQQVDTDTLETDLNLSVASSTTETTLDECQSQSSSISPNLIPLRNALKNNPEYENTASDRSSSLLSLHSDSVKSSSADDTFNFCITPKLVSNDQVVKIEEAEHLKEKIRVEVEETDPSLCKPSLPLSQVLVANLAAEVVSGLNSKSEEVSKKGRNEDKKASKKRSIQKTSPVFNEEVFKYFDNLRNAKEVMSENDYAKLSKPFQFGWRRECVLMGSGREISLVYYVTPSHPGVGAKRLKSSGLIGEYLKVVGETNLSLDNFSMRKMFLGFGAEYEFVRNSFLSTGLRSGEAAASGSSGSGWKGDNSDNSRSGWKYDNFFEVVTKNDEKRFKCLLCGSLFTQKGNFGRHVKVYHEPDVTCDKCGEQFRPIHIQEHSVRCREGSEVDIKTVVKRKRKEELKVGAKMLKEEKIDEAPVIVPNNNNNSNSNTSKPVAKKSSPPCQVINNLIKLDKIKDSNLCKEYAITNVEPFNPKDRDAGTVVKVDAAKLSGGDSSSILTIPKIKAEESQPAKDVYSGPTLVKSEPIVMDKPNNVTTLVMVSAEGTRVRMQVKVHAKLVKGMKKFGLRMGISYENLRFLLDGKELTGQELAGGLDGANILVERRDF